VEIFLYVIMSLATLAGLAAFCLGAYLLVAKKFRGKTTIKLAGFGEVETTHPGLALSFLGIFLFVCAFGLFFQAKKTREALEALMTATAKDLFAEFHRVIDNEPRPVKKESFRRTEELIALLRRIDPENGHALYYEGEVNRFEERCQQATDSLQRYVDIADSLPESEKGGDISQAICYQRAHGYCRQRTGWVLYLLAHRLYWQGLEGGSPSMQKAYFADALRKLDGSKEAFRPSVFNNLIPTEALDEAIKAQLKALNGGGAVINTIRPKRAC